VRLAWSADLAGQGWGINPDIGGYQAFEEMRLPDPDFFLFSGDTIYADGPLGLVVADGETNVEAVANADPGAPLGRELQPAELLGLIKNRRVTGTVWLTADVHYTSAQHYQPTRAAFTEC
jgi:phosphodiesterase/alkaline phosphatase D-like protein